MSHESVDRFSVGLEAVNTMPLCRQRRVLQGWAIKALRPLMQHPNRKTQSERRRQQRVRSAMHNRPFAYIASETGDLGRELARMMSDRLEAQAQARQSLFGEKE